MTDEDCAASESRQHSDERIWLAWVAERREARAAGERHKAPPYADADKSVSVNVVRDLDEKA